MGFPFVISNKLLHFTWLIKNKNPKSKTKTPIHQWIVLASVETTFNINNYNVFAGTTTKRSSNILV